MIAHTSRRLRIRYRMYPDRPAMIFARNGDDIRQLLESGAFNVLQGLLHTIILIDISKNPETVNTEAAGRRHCAE